MSARPIIILTCTPPFSLDEMAAYREAKDIVRKLNEKFVATDYTMNVPKEIIVPVHKPLPFVQNRLLKFPVKVVLG